MIDYTPKITGIGLRNFSIVGRALSIATAYDQNLKFYLRALAIRNPLYFQENVAEFSKIQNIDTLEARVTSVEKITGKISLHRAIEILLSIALESLEVDYIQEKLLSAKASRNFIAHELCLNNIELFNTPEGSAYIREALPTHISAIAESLAGIEVFIGQFNNLDIPNISDFAQKISDWVFSVE